MTHKAVFFDVDGTYIRWQFFYEWIKAMVVAGFLPNHVLTKTKRALEIYQARQGDFNEFIKVSIRSYQDNARLKGILLEEAYEVAQDLVQETGDHVHVFPRELLNAAKRHGYLPIFISGSPSIAVKALAEHHGVEHFIGTDHPDDGDVEHPRFTGGKPKEWVYDKAEAVDHLQVTLGLDLKNSVAIGDSPSDAAMLSKVGYAIAFNPSRRFMKEHVYPQEWSIVVERKDNILLLKHQSFRLLNDGISYLCAPIPVAIEDLSDVLPKDLANDQAFQSVIWP
ncbi:HAD-IB family phosphatase [Candidatus Uhrbacteria bacterium]|nr:HAD-IB family phosphatase [Candidatus Uhrbacteria bacterium]MBD3284529.1 HAD-IB family phosphatase [Candidatus Uhrbacteria bacterium]